MKKLTKKVGFFIYMVDARLEESYNGESGNYIYFPCLHGLLGFIG